MHLVCPIQNKRLVPVIICTITAILCFMSASSVAAKKSKNNGTPQILFINSYHFGYKWSDDIMEATETKLHELLPTAKLFYEFLDTKNFPSRSHLSIKLDEIQEKFKNISIDLIITADNNAFNFIIENRSLLYPKVPIVFCGLNFYTPQLIIGHDNITGIVERTNLEINCDLLLSLHPSAKSIIFITDPTSPSGSLNLRQLEAIRPQLESRVKVIKWNSPSISKDIDMVKKLETDSLLFIIGSSYNLDGTLLDNVEQGKRLSQASKVPIFSMWDFSLGTGIVGGYMVNGTDQGLAAADIAARILTGQSANKIPVITNTPASYMFDFQALKRFNLSDSSLPDGSIVINRPASIYQTHKKFFWTVFALISALCVLVVFLSINIKMRYRAEKKLREYADTLENEVNKRTQHLQKTLEQVKTLSGLLPICSYCKKIRDDKGYWNQIESYIQNNSDAEFSHGICKECAKKYYPDMDIYEE